jgi:GNAT superfamily N-acetyltransferase
MGMRDRQIAGFSVVDMKERNIWALFVHPDHEGKGIGKALHDIMLDWYFVQSNETVWLSTEPGTRAETFYRSAGWREAGITPGGEVKFEMSSDTWNRRG